MIDEVRAELLRRLAHDLRSPLGVLKGTLDRLHQLAGADEREAALKRAERAVERLARLADHLSLAGRAPQGFIVTRQSVNLRQTALAALEQVQRSEPRAGVEAMVRGEASWPTDPSLLAALLDELLSNALRHAARRVDVEVGQAALTVEDDGPGVPPERAVAVFEQPTSSSHGLGLGLPLALELARALGLRLELVAGNSGALSRFVIRR